MDDNFIISEKALENGMLEIEFVPEVMRDSVHGCYFLQRRNELRIQELVDNLVTIPSRITKISFQIIPSKDSIYYQSFSGIESIIYFLFLTDNVEINKEILKQKVFLKTYFIKERYSIYKIPVIGIEIIFLGELSERTYDYLGNNLAGSNGFLNYTSQTGDIEYIDIASPKDLEKQLHIQLLIGQEEFLFEGLFKNNGYSKSQLVELNHIHGVGLIQLNMKKIILEADVNFFDELRTILPKIGHDEIYNQIESIFHQNESISDGLPF